MVDFIEESTGPFSPAVGKTGSHIGPTSVCLKLGMRERRTPDFAELRMYEEIPVFLYSDDKFGGNWHRHVSDANSYGDAHTLWDKYEMRDSHYGPVVFEIGKDEVTSGHIKGELYGLPVEGVAILDELYLQGTIFKRVWKRILLEDFKIDTFRTIRGKSFTNALMYVGTKSLDRKTLALKTRFTYSKGGSKEVFYEHIPSSANPDKHSNEWDFFQGMDDEGIRNYSRRYNPYGGGPY